MSQRAQDSNTTSHYATAEECCYRMAKKYGWSLLEARQKIEAKHPLTWECIFEGEAEFPESPIDKSAGGRDA